MEWLGLLFIAVVACVAMGALVVINMDFRAIRCWWRGMHREGSVGWFRYDVGGWCADCGKVGDGVNHNDYSSNTDTNAALIDSSGHERVRRSYMAEAQNLKGKKSMITITVSGETGSGKSAIVGEI